MRGEDSFTSGELAVYLGWNVRRCQFLQHRLYLGAGPPDLPWPGWLLVLFTSLWGADIGCEAWAPVFALRPHLPGLLYTHSLASTYVP